MASAFHFLDLARLYRITAMVATGADRFISLDRARFYLRLAHDCPAVRLP